MAAHRFGHAQLQRCANPDYAYYNCMFDMVFEVVRKAVMNDVYRDRALDEYAQLRMVRHLGPRLESV